MEPSIRSMRYRGERNEPDLLEMKRLVFRFDRRNLAQLRLLIDFINAAED